MSIEDETRRCGIWLRHGGDRRAARALKAPTAASAAELRRAQEQALGIAVATGNWRSNVRSSIGTGSVTHSAKLESAKGRTSKSGGTENAEASGGFGDAAWALTSEEAMNKAVLLGHLAATVSAQAEAAADPLGTWHAQACMLRQALSRQLEREAAWAQVSVALKAHAREAEEGRCALRHAVADRIGEGLVDEYGLEGDGVESISIGGGCGGAGAGRKGANGAAVTVAPSGPGPRQLSLEGATALAAYVEASDVAKAATLHATHTPLWLAYAGDAVVVTRRTCTPGNMPHRRGERASRHSFTKGGVTAGGSVSLVAPVSEESLLLGAMPRLPPVSVAASVGAGGRGVAAPAPGAARATSLAVATLAHPALETPGLSPPSLLAPSPGTRGPGALAPPPLAPPPLGPPPLGPLPMTSPPTAPGGGLAPAPIGMVPPPIAPPGGVPPPPPFAPGAGCPPPPHLMPPGMPGAPPPPPPPPGGAGIMRPGAIVPRKAAVTPGAKMRVMHWSRLVLDVNSEADKQTLWWSLPDVPFDVEGFEERFAQKVARPGGCGVRDSFAGGGPRGSMSGAYGGAGFRREKTKVLEPKRSNAIGILISRLPELKLIRAAIRDLDDSVLEREQIEQVRLQLPTAEEAEEITSRDGADVMWDKPEAFLRTLLSIPRVSSRLRCWSISRSFAEAADTLDAPITALTMALTEVAASEAMRVVLGALLAYGNHMNGGTSRGQADGFAMTDLMSVSGAKAADNRQTLLSYALKELTALAATAPKEADAVSAVDSDVELLRGSVPSIRPSLPLTAEAVEAAKTAETATAGSSDGADEGAAEAKQRALRAKRALAFETTMPHLREGAKASLGELQAQQHILTAEVAEVARVAAAEPESPAHVKLDPFKRRMTEFASAAQSRVDGLATALHAAEASLAELRRFFGLAPSALKDDELLPFFCNFADEVKRSMPPPEKRKRAPRLPALPPPGMQNAASTSRGLDQPPTGAVGAEMDTMSALIASIHMGRRGDNHDVGSGTGRDVGADAPAGSTGVDSRSGSAEQSGQSSSRGASAVAAEPLSDAVLMLGVTRSRKGSNKSGNIGGGCGPRERSGSRGATAAGAATQIDSSLFGRANTSFEAGNGRRQAQSARAAVVARLKEQESREARFRALNGGGIGLGATARPTVTASASVNKSAATVAPTTGGGWFGRKPKLGTILQPASKAHSDALAATPAPSSADEVAPEDEANVAPAAGGAILTMRL